MDWNIYTREVKTLAKPDLLRNLSGKDTLLPSVLNIEDLERHSLYRIFRVDLQLLGERRGMVFLSHETIPLWEYELAVISRLDLLLLGEARGLAVFFFIS
jgi:hypothetical protein